MPPQVDPNDPNQWYYPPPGVQGPPSQGSYFGPPAGTPTAPPAGMPAPGAGGAAAPNATTPNIGAGAGVTPSNPVAGNLLPPPDVVNDPQGAAIRALRMQGWNPGSFHPFVRAVLKRANDLANELVIKAAGGGTLQDLGDPQKALGALAALIGQAGSGQSVFGGATPSAIQNIVASAARGNQPGEVGAGITAGDRLMAQLLSDTGRASNLFSEAMYGGMTPHMQAAMQSGLVPLMDTYQQMLESSAQTAPENFLAMLIGQLTGGGQGAGALGPYGAATMRQRMLQQQASAPWQQYYQNQNPQQQQQP